MPSHDASPPPGSTGWPLLGETLAFLNDQYHFVDERRDAYGEVFQTSVLTRPTVVLSGPEGTAVFNDDTKVQRSGAMPSHVEKFFGGASLPLLDGDAHRTRKHLVMSAFSPEALDAYMPILQSTTERWLAEHARGAEVRAVDALKRLALEMLARTMTSMEPGPEFETVFESFAVLAGAFAALPIPLPGTAFTRGIAARDAIFAVYRRAVAAHRASPRDDGLGRMLAARAADGSQISDDGAVLELHHFNIAGYLVYTQLAMTLLKLHEHADLRGALRDEIMKSLGEGPITVASLAGLSALDRFTMELKRYTPFVGVFFGKAKRAFEYQGRTIPEGWMVLWSHHGSNRTGPQYDAPERFDPSRFDAPRAEQSKHPCAFAPQGAGPLLTSHKCAGYDFSTLAMKVFTVALLRGYAWDLPPQDTTYRWNMVPPEPADGLRVVLRPRG